MNDFDKDHFDLLEPWLACCGSVCTSEDWDH